MVRQFLAPLSHCHTDEQRTLSPERRRLVVISGGILLPDCSRHDRSRPSSEAVSGATGAPVLESCRAVDDLSGSKLRRPCVTIDANDASAPAFSGTALAIVANGDQRLYLPEPAGECLQTLNPELVRFHVSIANNCDFLQM